MEGAFSLAKKGQRFKKYPIQIKEKAVKLYYENMLPKSRKYREGSIFHTDRGFQYTHILTAKMLKMHGIVQSMCRMGVPEDKGPAESFFSHFKEEVVKIEGDKTKEEYMKLIDDYIEFYNNRRYQMRLNKMAPVEYRSQMYGT